MSNIKRKKGVVMKFLSIVILSCLAFSSVHAASEFPTSFEELGEMFDQGTLPTEEETFGWWSGRCYYTSEPSNPFSNLLVSRLITDNHGPAFPEPLHQMLVLAYIGSRLADYFDNDLLKFKDDVEEDINSKEAREFIATEKDGSLYASPTLLRSHLNLNFALRKYKNYFISQSILNQNYTSRDNHEWKVGDVYYNCYFFKKVY